MSIRQFTNTVFFTFFLFLLLLPFALASAEESVDSLLKEVDSSLAPRNSGASVEPKRSHKKANSRPAESKPAPAAQPTPQAPQSLQPLDDPKVDEVLALDSKAAAEVHAPKDPRLEFGVFTEGLTLGSSYRLTKDDDIFEPQAGQKLWGGIASFGAHWGLPDLNPWSKLRLHLQVRAGFLRGKVTTHRSGVTVGTTAIDDSLVPIVAQLGVSADLYERVELRFFYGGQAEFLNQIGAGYYDSSSDLFMGDRLSFGVFYDWSDLFKTGLEGALRGVLPFPQSRRTSGAELALGLHYQLPN